VGQYVETLQYVDVEADAGQYEPGGQMVLGLAAYTEPVGQKNPAAHGPERVESALNRQYDPAVHTVGADKPVLGQK
jgi:hypothetical protein